MVYDTPVGHRRSWSALGVLLAAALMAGTRRLVGVVPEEVEAMTTAGGLVWGGWRGR